MMSFIILYCCYFVRACVKEVLKQSIKARFVPFADKTTIKCFVLPHQRIFHINSGCQKNPLFFFSFFILLKVKTHKMNVDRKICMIPGPIEFDETVLQKMATPATSHVDPNFVPIFGEAIEMVRKVVISETAQPFIVSGSGTLGWDMMVNLIEQGDEVLLLNTGYFGSHFAQW